MLLIFISLILAVVSMILLGITKNNRGQTIIKFRGRCFFGLLWLLIILVGCFSIVETGEVGIKTRFGKITNTYLKEGINFKAPYEMIEKVNVKVQKYENEDDLETSTKDMPIVNSIKVSINYQIDGSKAPELYRNVGNG